MGSNCQSLERSFPQGYTKEGGQGHFPRFSGQEEIVLGLDLKGDKAILGVRRQIYLNFKICEGEQGF